jgi:O-antigen ligase
MMVGYFLRRRDLVQRVVLFGSLPVFALALMYTYSRGPLLGVACGMVWLGLTGKGVRSFLPLILICCVSGYLLMPAQSRVVLQQMITSSADLDSGDSIGGGSVRARLNLFQVGLQFSRKNMWFGLGPNAVRQERVTYGGGYDIPFYSVDNYYLQTLLWHGAIVLALVVGLYLYLLSFFTRAALRLADPELALLAALAAAMCIANYVALVTVGFNITLFWILLGPAFRLCYAGPTARLQRRRPWSRADRGIEQGTGGDSSWNESTLPAADRVRAASDISHAGVAASTRAPGA